jgi:hypothetical protein
MMYNRKVFIAVAIAAFGTADARMLQSRRRLVQMSNDNSIVDSKPSTKIPIVQDNIDKRGGTEIPIDARFRFQYRAQSPQRLRADQVVDSNSDELSAENTVVEDRLKQADPPHNSMVSIQDEQADPPHNSVVSIHDELLDPPHNSVVPIQDEQADPPHNSLVSIHDETVSIQDKQLRDDQADDQAVARTSDDILNDFINGPAFRSRLLITAPKGMLRQTSISTSSASSSVDSYNVLAVEWSTGILNNVGEYKLVDRSEDVAAVKIRETDVDRPLEVQLRFRKWLEMANSLEALVLQVTTGKRETPETTGNIDGFYELDRTNDRDMVEIEKVKALSAATSNLRADKWSVGGGGGRFGGLFGKVGTNSKVMIHRQALLKTWYKAWRDLASHDSQFEDLRTGAFKEAAIRYQYL